eukprot:m.184982 g.184982  ORF g.184982 m.184982 type:complete len:648 (-) comp16291_c0_seq1:262-2205(-)
MTMMLHVLSMAATAGPPAEVYNHLAWTAEWYVQGRTTTHGPPTAPWKVVPNMYCAPQDPLPPVTWSVSFDDCYHSCLQSSTCTTFYYTNGTRWSGKTGCVVVTGQTCTQPCTSGDCGNWDMYECTGGAAGNCTTPPEPPAPPPPPPVPFGFHPALSDHMVLQRLVPARVWGSGATPNGTVTVTLSGATTTTTKANATGDWQVDLMPRNASTTPVNVTATDDTSSTAVVLHDVLFGDVWGCHGQSNMVFGLGQDIAADTICPAANNYPLIRFMEFTGGKAWQVSSNTTACTGKGFAPFSAVCYYFGLNTFNMLGGNIPVGLVFSAIGGTAIERWSGPDALSQCNQTGVVSQSTLWNPYITPLLPMRMSGWTWYQGESNVACSVSWKWMPGLNCGIGCTQDKPVCNASIDGCASFYKCAFPAMISDWRNKWNGGGESITGRKSGPLPFLFVELAPYTEGVGEPGDISVAVIRESQKSALTLPSVGMAAAYDYGDPASPLGNIHPRYKAPVGARLALAAQHVSYGGGPTLSTSLNPTLVSASISGSDSRSVLLQFNAPVFIRAPVLGVCPVSATSCAWMSVAGLNATLSQDSVNSTTVRATLPSTDPPVPHGAVVSYLYGDWPVPTIYRAGDEVPSFPGFPAMPFLSTAT